MAGRGVPVIARVPLPDGSEGMVRMRRLEPVRGVTPAELAERLRRGVAGLLADVARDAEGLRISLDYRDDALLAGAVAGVTVEARVGAGRRVRPAEAAAAHRPGAPAAARRGGESGPARGHRRRRAPGRRRAARGAARGRRAGPGRVHRPAARPGGAARHDGRRVDPGALGAARSRALRAARARGRLAARPVHACVPPTSVTAGCACRRSWWTGS